MKVAGKEVKIANRHKHLQVISSVQVIVLAYVLLLYAVTFVLMIIETTVFVVTMVMAVQLYYIASRNNKAQHTLNHK